MVGRVTEQSVHHKKKSSMKKKKKTLRRMKIIHNKIIIHLRYSFRLNVKFKTSW